MYYLTCVPVNWFKLQSSRSNTMQLANNGSAPA
jgi:hypothetical protein